MKGVYAPLLLKELSELGGPDMVITCDVGQHQMWVAQHCKFRNPTKHLSSGGLGTMGYGLPAAIGAKVADPESMVVCVAGDGSIMMNIQEIGHPEALRARCENRVAGQQLPGPGATVAGVDVRRQLQRGGPFGQPGFCRR